VVAAVGKHAGHAQPPSGGVLGGVVVAGALLVGGLVGGAVGGAVQRASRAVLDPAAFRQAP
jgi:hypothetical protein